jgi:hypothetical protein
LSFYVFGGGRLAHQSILLFSILTWLLPCDLVTFETNVIFGCYRICSLASGSRHHREDLLCGVLLEAGIFYPVVTGVLTGHHWSDGISLLAETGK